MSKIDEAISETAYILDVLMSYRRIVISGGDCNICAIERECDYAITKPGEHVRYNCPLFVSKKDVEVEVEE